MRSLLFLLCLFFAVTGHAADIISGEVVGISDGDTLTLLTPDKEQLRVRLGEIDTPERRQPYGTRARQALADKVFREQVRVDVETTDRYGRIVGHVLLGERNINAEMVAEGNAWVYRDYLRHPWLLDLEEQAREARRGLWSLPEAQRVPPWEWRRGERGATARNPPSVDDSGALRCGSKRYCGQMSSCAEASFYLNRCGLDRLDGDGDGVPCEALCR